MPWFLKFLTGPILGSIFQPLINGYITIKKNELDAADNKEERIKAVALQALQNDIKDAELNNKINIIEAGGKWYQRLPRPMMGMAAMILVWKILVWDLALGQWTKGHTDPLSDQAFWLLTTVVVAYFGGRTIDKGMNVLANIFGKKP